MMRRFLSLIVVLAAAVLADRLGGAAAWAQPFLPRVALGVFGLVFLLAWRFRRGRIAWASALLGGTAALFELGPGPFVGLGEALPAVLAVVLAFDLLVLGILTEWPVASAAGGWRFLVLGAEVLGLGLLARWATEEGRQAFLGLGGDLVPGLDRLGLGLPPVALLAFAVAALGLAFLARRRGTLEAGFLVALGAVFAALELGPPLYYLAAGGLVLGLALVENAFSLAFEDGLTGLPARRSLEETLRHLGRTYAIAMLDLDHFKKLNDRHGHEVGDQVLQMVASKLGGIGGGGRPFRYGGEEFTVVFPGKSASEAELYVEELRRQVAESKFVVRSPDRPKAKPEKTLIGGKSGTTKTLKVTMSVGLAERNDRHRLPEQVMKAADKALYRSKKAGRNRVTIGK